MSHADTARSVTLMTEVDPVQDMHWSRDHEALIRLACGCWWCEECGSLRALPECEGHKRDVERYGSPAA